MSADIIVGIQWGDEGKGKIVDMLAQKYDMVCRSKVDTMLVILFGLME